jgi:MFS family permease
VIYGAGSLTTAFSQSLPVLLFGWSLLEGLGAALILPAIVALVAGNFSADRRQGAYGLIAAALAMAVALGPLIGGLATTYASWRWVFVGEVVVLAFILLFAGRIAEAEPEKRPKLDFVGMLLSSAGLGIFVFGVLKSSTWGWVTPKPDAPEWLGMSPVPWLLAGGLLLLWLFMSWEERVSERNGEPLLDLSLLRNDQLKGGLSIFFLQFFIQMGIFFLLPLYLSVALGLSALDTGLRIMPLSVTLLAAAILIPKLWPTAPPRLVVRLGLFAMLAGILVLIAALEPGAGAEIVTVPLLLVGLGVGALSSQLGAVTVSAVPDEKSPEVGGLQNTVTNLGASLSTALVGSVMIAALTSSFLTQVEANPDIPDDAKDRASVELAGGIPFISDDDLEQALDDADADPDLTDDAIETYEQARLDGLRLGLLVTAIAAFAALFVARRIPRAPPGAPAAAASSP